MSTPVTMPVLGLTMEEGTVAEWLKQEGDVVALDEPLLTVEMDKGTLEVPSPVAGVLRRIVVSTGITVAVRTLIAEIDEPVRIPASSAAGGGPPPDNARRSSERSSAESTLAEGGPGDLPSPAITEVGSSSVERESATTMAADGSSLDRARGSVTLAEGPGAFSGSAPRLFASPRARMRARALGVELRTVRGSGPMGRIVEADVLAGSTSSAASVLSTPLARRLAEQHGLDLAAVSGSGPSGRITQDDVLRAAESRTGESWPPAAQPSASEPAAERSGDGNATGTNGDRDRGVRVLSRVRRITAERMAESARATARVTLFFEADFAEASRFRSQLQPELARLGVPKLPWDALIARAAALALVEHPTLLAQWVEGEGLREPAGVNVGIGVALEPEGLVVPVLRDAATRSLRDLSAELLALVEKARANRLTPAEMDGGTFTITNLGAYGVDGFTPILNPPETAILGVGRIADKATVVQGRLEARTMCTLSLSFDHRVVDGASAAAFLARLALLLERPYALLGL